jgi:DNA-binding SARP family transcriptional activator
MVQNSELIDELWGANPPPSAQSTLQTYIYKLRQILTEPCKSVHEDLLQTKLHGYLIRIPEDDLDLCRFQRLAEEGRKALDSGDSEPAGRILSQALSLWRGPALADVDTGEVLAAHATRLEEDRVQTLEARLEADLQRGRHQEVISELKALALGHPLHEGYHAKLMVALHRSGRRGEALDVYQQLRRGLIEELGLEPGRELVVLQRALLSSDPAFGSRSTTSIVMTQNARPAGSSPPRAPLPRKPQQELNRAWTAGTGQSKDASPRYKQGGSEVSEQAEQSTPGFLAEQERDQQSAPAPRSKSSMKEMTSICEETVELVKEAIVTVTSAVVKPLEWESDCTSTLRQLSRVLGLIGTMRDSLGEEAGEARCARPDRAWGSSGISGR